MWGRNWAGPAVVLALMLVPSGAAGATTVGETFVSDTPCTSFTTYVQSDSVSGQYSMPGAGVVTSWSHQAGAAAANLKFKVLRPRRREQLHAGRRERVVRAHREPVEFQPGPHPRGGRRPDRSLFRAGPNAICGASTGNVADSLRSAVGDVSGSGIEFAFLNSEARINLRHSSNRTPIGTVSVTSPRTSARAIFHPGHLPRTGQDRQSEGQRSGEGKEGPQGHLQS